MGDYILYEIAFHHHLLIFRAAEKCCEHVGCFTNDPPFDDRPLPRCLKRIRPRMVMYNREVWERGEEITRSSVP